MNLSIKTITFACLLAIMMVAVFFRFYRLDSIPPGLYPDIAINGNNALQSYQSGDYKPFYTDNNGREGLIMWLDALSMAIFGITPLALKIPAAFFGTLTVLGIYLLARELFEKHKNSIALLSAFLLATSFWHVMFSRIGFRVILEPFFLVFTMYFLWRALKPSITPESRTLGVPRVRDSGKLGWAVISGICFGLGFYTYTGYRLAVPLLICALGLWLAIFWKSKTQWAKISLAALIATFIIALPIGLYFFGNASDFIGRAGQTSVFSAPNPPYELGKSLVLHLGMFNIYGDGNWRHNYPGAPELFLPVGVLFLLGIALASSNIIKSVKIRNFGLEFQSYSLLLLWLIFMLLPGVLTSEGIPHALRTFGVIPAAIILSAIGGVALYEWLKSRWPKIAVIGIAAIFILATAFQGYWLYFIAWANNDQISGAFTDYFVKIGAVSAQFHDQGRQTVIVVNENGTPVPYPDGIPMPAQTVKFIETADCYQRGGFISKTYCAPYSTYILPSELDQAITSPGTAIILMKDEEAIFSQLQNIYPQGQIKSINNIRYYEIN